MTVAGEAGTAPDEMEVVAAAEESNLQQTRRVFGTSLTLVHDVLGLYGFLADLNRDSGATEADTYPAIQFMLECRVRVTKALLEAGRGHISGSMGQTRRAIEACGLAVVLRRSPELEETWARAFEDEETFKAYKKAFRGKVPPRDDDTTLRDLRARYDLASKVVHVSLVSQARSLTFERDGKHRTVKLSYVELDAEKDPSEPFRTYFWILQTHLLILKVLAGLMPKAVDHDRSTWDVRYNAIDGKMLAHFQQWHADGRLPMPGEK